MQNDVDTKKVPVGIQYTRFDEFQLRSSLKEFENAVDFELVQQIARFNAEQVLGRMTLAESIADSENQI